MSSLAPILVSVYNRLSHLQSCIKALQLNDLAINSDLFIVSDGPKHQKDEGIIKDIRNYVPTISGFNSVTLIAHEKNLGAIKSINTARNALLNKREKLIFLEDDIIVTQKFLDYMNRGLDFYADDQRIFSIAAYTFPIKLPSDYNRGVYTWYGYTGWGVGLWNDRWTKVDWELSGFNDFLKDKTRVAEFNRIAEHVLPILKRNQRGNAFAGDAILSYHMFNNDLLTIFPVVSKVRNIGHDGTGENCGITDIYRKQEIDDDQIRIRFEPGIKPSNEIDAILQQHFKRNIKIKFYSFFKYHRLKVFRWLFQIMSFAARIRKRIIASPGIPE